MPESTIPPPPPSQRLRIWLLMWFEYTISWKRLSCKRFRRALGKKTIFNLKVNPLWISVNEGLQFKFQIQGKIYIKTWRKESCRSRETLSLTSLENY
jgi:hypothetical protein